MDGKRIAIVIGMSEFNDKNLTSLRGPAQDAIRLANVLQDPAIGNYEVKIFINSSSHSVNKAIEQLFSTVERNDTVVFYYSGHAKLDGSGQLYLAATDTDMRFLRSTAIPASFVN
ncbi:MAG: caspase family protein [Candidatus Electronema sp. VV]